MRSIAAILFAALYLLFNTGLGINTNYCGAKVSSVEFSLLDTMCCCGFEKTASDCCSTETQLYQIVEDQNIGNTPKIVLQDDLVVGWCCKVVELKDSQNEALTRLDIPPDIGDSPPYLKYSRLILFG